MKYHFISKLISWALQWMGSGPPGSAGEPAVFHVEAGPDRGHAFVQAPPLSMVAGSVKATTCTSISVTATLAQVSRINFYLLLLVRFYKLCILTTNTHTYIFYPSNLPVFWLFSFFFLS